MPVRIDRSLSLPATESGYREAYAGYQELNARYDAELKKPRFTVGRSIELIAAAGGGLPARGGHP
jgi:hypothetical protein